jgi:hypothetical protein
MDRYYLYVVIDLCQPLSLTQILMRAVHQSSEHCKSFYKVYNKKLI